MGGSGVGHTMKLNEIVSQNNKRDTSVMCRAAGCFDLKMQRNKQLQEVGRWQCFLARTLRLDETNRGRDRSKQGVEVGCHQHIASALHLSSELLKLSNEPREDCEHDGCLLLDGVARDCAWKIRQVALQWRADLTALNGIEEKKLTEVER